MSFMGNGAGARKGRAMLRISAKVDYAVRAMIDDGSLLAAAGI